MAESKRLLEETRAEILEQKERESIPPKHTFSPLPGLQYRKREVKVLKTCLSSIPNFTVLFGGTSVGKTALLRQVLTDERYHVIHFDLRLSGFADISSLFFSFSCQMEQYFISLADRLEGYESFKKEALAFKHLRLDVERRLEKNGLPVKTSDIAHLLEIFQSCLLKYWEFTPEDPQRDESENEGILNKPLKEWQQKKDDIAERKIKQKTSQMKEQNDLKDQEDEVKGMEASRAVKFEEGFQKPSQPTTLGGEEQAPDQEECKWKPPTKLIPVFFLDEAHKLPSLIKDSEAMKCLLDALLVLTKQDRLCHVINATSDPFYMYWLRNMNVLTHCTIITIGDPTKKEAQQFFNENLVSSLKDTIDQQPVSATRVGESKSLRFKPEISNQTSGQQPQSERYELDFDLIYDTFGGKLAHLQGFVSDYLNSGGRLKPHQSSPFLQAYALLQYHLIHPQYLHPEPHYSTSHRPEKLEKLEPKNLLYAISKFTTIEIDRLTGEVASNSPLITSASNQMVRSSEGRSASPKPRFKKPSETFSYFTLSRQIGIESVDHLVKHHILDLRWTPPVSSSSSSSSSSSFDEGEGDYDERQSDHPKICTDLPDPPGSSFIEPVLLPVSPVMKAAMQLVLEKHSEENLLV